MQSIPEGCLPIISPLGQQITELAAHIDAAQYQFLNLLGRFDSQEEWADAGILSCAHWLNIHCGISLGAGRERVRVARALPQLPKISSAFRKGRVSYSKVRAMTRVATAENEAFLLETAESGTASQVEKVVRHYRRFKRIEKLEEDNIRFAQRKVNLFQDDDDSWVIRGRLTAEQGALLQKALELGAEQLFQEQQDVPEEVETQLEESQPLDQPTSETAESRRADALTRMAEAFVANTNSQASGGDAYLVNIHTDVDTLKADGDNAEAECGGHGHVSAETCRRISCDASVVQWLDKHNGEPLSIGRKTRTIPPAIRRALQRRDGGCRFPGCTCTRFVDAHHIIHWADGGETRLENLVLLCRRHHRLVHEEGYTIQPAGHGEIHFSLPDGRTLRNSYHGRFRGNVRSLTAGNREPQPEITAFTSIPRQDGEPLDYNMALDVLIQQEKCDPSRRPGNLRQ